MWTTKSSRASCHLLSLLDIMNRLHVEQLGADLVKLQNIQGYAECVANHLGLGPGTPVHPDQLRNFSQTLRDLDPLLKQVEMEKSRHQVELVSVALATFSHPNVATISTEVRRLTGTIISELAERKFLFVASDRLSYYDNENLFGAAAVKRFPMAKADIIAAGNCLCAECDTAAVFHLMRVFEWALRTLCGELSMKRMADYDKVQGRFKYMPTDFAIWEKILNQLPRKVEQRLRLLRPGLKRQKLQEYYGSALEDIKGVKDVWRNHVMHTRKTFNRDDAMAVFSHVNSIMGRLAPTPQELR